MNLIEERHLGNIASERNLNCLINGNAWKELYGEAKLYVNTFTVNSEHNEE
jgi:hypothetical protein